MNRPFIASLLLHATLLAALIFGVHLGKQIPAETPITVEIVTAEAAKPSPAPPRPDPAETAPLPPRPAAAPPPPPPAPRPAREPEARPAPPPPAEAKPTPPPPPPPPPKAEPVPAPPPLKPEPAPKPAEASKPEPAPAKPQPRPAAPEPPPAPPKAKPEPAREPPEPPKAKPEKPAEVTKAEPKRERPTPPATKPEANDFDALLRSVEAQAKRVEAAEKRAGKGAAAEAGGTGQPGEVQQARVDPSALAAAISRQVTPCWNIPIAAQGIAGLRAELNIVMGPDGSVQSVAPTDAARMRTDPVFRAFAESAVRAVRACSPLKLPAESYQVWRNIIFNFDPSMMTG